jgi:hypothetical protein
MPRTGAWHRSAVLMSLGRPINHNALGRPVGEMRGPARGAGRSGASHPTAVNEALFALLRPKPDVSCQGWTTCSSRAAPPRSCRRRWCPARPGRRRRPAQRRGRRPARREVRGGAGLLPGGAHAEFVLAASKDEVPLPRNPPTVIPQLAQLTRRHWQGTAHDGFHVYDGKVPGMKMLKKHSRPGRSSGA